MDRVCRTQACRMGLWSAASLPRHHLHSPLLGGRDLDIRNAKLLHSMGSDRGFAQLLDILDAVRPEGWWSTTAEYVEPTIDAIRWALIHGPNVISLVDLKKAANLSDVAWDHWEPSVQVGWMERVDSGSVRSLAKTELERTGAEDDAS